MGTTRTSKYGECTLLRRPLWMVSPIAYGSLSWCLTSFKASSQLRYCVDELLQLLSRSRKTRQQWIWRANKWIFLLMFCINYKLLIKFGFRKKIVSLSLHFSSIRSILNESPIPKGSMQFFEISKKYPHMDTIKPSPLSSVAIKDRGHLSWFCRRSMYLADTDPRLQAWLDVTRIAVEAGEK